MSKGTFRYGILFLVALVLIPSVVGTFALLGGVHGKELLAAVSSAFGTVAVIGFLLAFFVLSD